MTINSVENFFLLTVSDLHLLPGPEKVGRVRHHREKDFWTDSRDELGHVVVTKSESFDRFGKRVQMSCFFSKLSHLNCVELFQ